MYASVEVWGDEHDDDALMRSIAFGDSGALVAFIRRFHSRVYGMALSVVGDPGLAEEVTQDAFLRVWRRASTFDSRRGRVASWLLTITHNLAVDAVRIRRDLPTDPVFFLSLPIEAADHRYQIDRFYQKQLQALPANQARPIVLVAFFGLTAKEIADREGIPLGTAKTRLRRGLARMRQSLRDSATLA